MRFQALRYWLLLASLVAAFVAVGWLRGWLGTGQGAPESGEGQRPAFTLPDLDGTPHSIDEWDGKIIVLNFWATWCPPCVDEVPELAAVQRKLGDRGVQVVGVAADEPKNIRLFLKQVQVPYPVLHGQAAAFRALKAYGNPRGTLPYTVIIDRRGVVRRTVKHALDRVELERMLAPLLAAASA